MAASSFSIRLFLFLALFGFVASSVAQDEKKLPEPTDQSEKSDADDVLKISTELIQTGVAVFDKKGQFINNLKQEDFELLVDGKPIPISFFEPNTIKRVSNNGEIKTEKNGIKLVESNKTSVRPLNGRTIIFVVDDLHLSFDSHNRTRKLILKFIDQEMLPEDTVAVVSSTGKIGFLQQFTSDKTALRAAVERLIFNRDRSAADRSDPPMSEYEAQLIDRYDQQVTDIFAAYIPGTDIESARQVVRSRARTVLSQAAAISRGTYSTLEQAVRNSAGLAGRKIVFFISDGFVLDSTNTDSNYRLKRITDAAARTNTVIYSFDPKGLEAGFPEGTAASFRVQAGERFELQDGLNAVAEETGGRFIKNTNDLQTGLTKSIEEASQYYLLAWEPVSENDKSERLRKIEVRVKNRPQLEVRVQSGYFDAIAKSSSKEENKNKPDAKTKTPLPVAQQQLNAAIGALFPARDLPTFLTTNHLDMPSEGALLAATMQINSSALEFTRQGDKATAAADILGIVYNADGKREGYFRELLNVDIPVSKLTDPDRRNIYYNYQKNLKPGLYQMRVAARDVKNGRIGSAVQWIKIPDLSSRKLTLSSLILSEQENERTKVSTENNVTDAGALQLPVSVDRRFARSSRLRYMVFIYNAAKGANQPDVSLQTQIFRGKTIVLTTPMNPISVTGQDPMRLPYAAEIPLNSFLPGRYEMQITVRDRASNTEAAQRVAFEVE